MINKQLGQFYTTNAEYITNGLLSVFDKNSIVIDPFCGNWDLLDLIENEKYGYDIDPQNELTIKQDTLLNTMDYSNKWIFTNPPYLARNKSFDKTIFNKYKVDDLYKAGIKSIMSCEGGILILPINFFSSEKNEIRNEFLQHFIIKRVNVFKQQVFEDTTYNVCAFSFIKGNNKTQKIPFYFYPENEKKEFILDQKYDYNFAAELYELRNNEIEVSRLLEGQKSNSVLYLTAIDSKNNPISISIKHQQYVGKKSDRVFATITFSKELSLPNQIKIADLFNCKLNTLREMYDSLFLSNFRDGWRKRISFSLTYQILKDCLTELGL